MKVVLAGAYGNLGADILKSLLRNGHEVVAADMAERDLGIETLGRPTCRRSASCCWESPLSMRRRRTVSPKDFVMAILPPSPNNSIQNMD